MFCYLVGVCALGQVLPPATRETFHCSLDGSCWPYLLQLPEAEPTAILIYLHGHFGDETQGMTEGIYGDTFGKLRRECARRNWAYATAWYGGNTWMGPVGEQGLADLIEVLRARWPERPVYLCGGSMGGSSALVFAVRRPELLAGVIALCPTADVESYYAYASGSASEGHRSIASAIRLHYTVEGRSLDEELAARSALGNWERLTMPLWLMHGSADDIIPVEPVREPARRLSDAGRSVHYVEIEGGGHDAPVVGIEWEGILDFVAGQGA